MKQVWQRAPEYLSWHCQEIPCGNGRHFALPLLCFPMAGLPVVPPRLLALQPPQHVLQTQRHHIGEAAREKTQAAECQSCVAAHLLLHLRPMAPWAYFPGIWEENRIPTPCF